MSDQYYEGIGRRKASSARVRVMSGNGAVVINGKPGEAYFPRMGDYQNVLAPLRTTGNEGRVSVSVIVQGGGVTGQADAVQHGLARALIQMSEEFRPVLRKAGYLTRDDRIKERKKPGLKRARKAPTFTKR
ncbi:MAG: 30S ribosomal protein S9 [Chloroflexi bacterium]|nr:30S ribosomal protein S9 [Chloroflexota bacterium]